MFLFFQFYAQFYLDNFDEFNEMFVHQKCHREWSEDGVEILISKPGDVLNGFQSIFGKEINGLGGWIEDFFDDMIIKFPHPIISYNFIRLKRLLERN